MGTSLTANRLINEKSPYLRQHAHNPVDWYPWGEEAFARAEQEDKPIFLSIGYSTCHWCHVMARESFADPEIARLLNQWFIAIKVDREERPDIDQVYMAVAQAMNGSGGWPLSLFLLPDGRPFWAATYIPPRSRNGRPGFMDILQAVHAAWMNRRSELVANGDRIISSISTGAPAGQEWSGKQMADRALSYLVDSFDARYGGFGSAPKFPRPVLFDFLMMHGHVHGNQQGLDMTLFTLRHMIRGGIFDQLGGGFHRYSVDAQWRVPHFEKMLYDQAQLLATLTDGWLLSHDRELEDAARHTAVYVLRDLQHPEGGFYSAEDADSEDPYHPKRHGEGAFYLWTEEEIVRVLGAEQAEVFNYCYGVEFEGNALHDPHHEFTGRNILYRAHTPAEAAVRFQRPESAIRAMLDRSRRQLMRIRSQRVRPRLDDKTLTGWNGLMIGALARAGAVFQDRDMIKAALRAAEFVRVHLYDRESRRLYRRYRDGEAAMPGQLDDYSYLIRGLLDLYQVVQDPHLLAWADSLAQGALDLFTDEQGGGLFDVLPDPRLPVRMKGDYDGAEPTPNAVFASDLLRLSRLLDRPQWLERARQIMDAFARSIATYPPALPGMLMVQLQLQRDPVQVVVAGSREGQETRALLDAVFSSYDPNRFLLLADGADNQKWLSSRLPFLTGVKPAGPRATAWVCRGSSCGLPVQSPDELRRVLAEPGFDPEKR